MIRRRDLLKNGAALAGGAILPGSLGRTAYASERQIGYWNTFVTERELKGFRNVVALFSARFKDIRFSPETIPNSEYMAKMTAASLARTLPDTAMLSADRVVDCVAMGTAKDITERVKSWSKFSEYSSDTWSGAMVGDKIFAVPAFQFTDWMYYRKDWLDEAGLQAPTNFDEFVAVAKKMTDPARNRYGFALRGGSLGQRQLFDIIEAFGSPLVVDGKAAIKRDLAIDAVTWASDLVTKHKVCPPGSATNGYRPMMDSFISGQSAMVWHSTGSLTEVQAALKPEQFATAVIPKGPKAHINRVTSIFNGILSDKNVEDAWKWISFWSEVEPAIAMFEETGYIPSAASAARNPLIADAPLFKAALEAASFGQQPPRFVGVNAWGEGVVLPEYQKVLIGRTTPAAAVDAMIAGLEEALR